MRILLGISWSDHQPYGQAPWEPRSSCSIRPQRERREQSLWTRRSSGSNAVLEAGSPGHPLSTWSCQSQLRCSAVGGTQLSDSVIYPPTNHLPLQRACPLAAAYSRLPFVLVLLFPLILFSSSSPPPTPHLFLLFLLERLLPSNIFWFLYSFYLFTSSINSWPLLFLGLCYHLLSACLSASPLLPTPHIQILKKTNQIGPDSHYHLLGTDLSHAEFELFFGSRRGTENGHQGPLWGYCPLL